MNASGFFTNGGERAVHRQQGRQLRLPPLARTPSFSATVRTADGTGSGWAEDASYRVGDVDAVDARRPRAAEGAGLRRPAGARSRRLHRDPRAGGGGGADRVQPRRRALGAHRRGGPIVLLEEGRRDAGRREGVPRVGHAPKSDPTDARRPRAPWAGAGGGGGRRWWRRSAAATPTSASRRSRSRGSRTGVLKKLSYDRYWAKKAERAPTPRRRATSSRRRQGDARGPDRLDRARAPGHQLLVHPRR